MSAIYRKEIRVYFSGMFAWIIAAVLLFFLGLFTALFNLLTGFSGISYTLSSMQWVLLVIIPLLTMRAIAEERHSRTDQLLYSLPIRLRDVVLAKYFAACTVFLLPTLVYALYPLILSGFGELSLATAYTALFGYILMGAALISVSLFVSSLVENQIVAGAVSLVVCFAFWFLQSYASGVIPGDALVSFLICMGVCLLMGVLVWRLSRSLAVGLIGALILMVPTLALFFLKKAWFERLIPDFLEAINPFSRVAGFFYGSFDVEGLIFYLTCIFICLFLTVQAMEARRKI